ncbi:DNA cytosine methyltransferase [Prolixibacter denitrificans]|uniref:DNA (cytosine-5-)-methyltransferase n=1 Tax=Prolixibacter denitrificans TaxID=1541063 RepID=A0A2P8C5D6_9BACT|nr:DNA cytosine methyltransferase [Prolixibacter denitrificans]PSK80190.1 DNA (cytosine-5)-methyltransferase 1 [Prolixibacter denitrificans]GET22381.1 cytosine-specific methyltransferase [Prolixibacter denitrificans]
MGSNNQTLKALDFFCSIGGVSLGFKQAGIEVLGGIDIDESCKETYERNIDSKFLCEDVSQLNFEKVSEYFEIQKNQDDLILVGCSPCQYYSNIKTDKTKSCKTRLLLADFQEFVEYYRPGYVFIENVPGLDSKPESPLGQFKAFLKKNKYVFTDDVLNAKYFGVPQNRRRYILIASRVKKAKIELPKEDRKNIVTVKDAIGDYGKFPPIKHGAVDKSAFSHTSAKLSPINLKRIKSTPRDGGGRLDWKNKKLQPACYANHDGHTDVYGRMSWNKPSPTITTRFVSYSNGRYGHPEQDRAISLREGATLQSFPEDFIFYSESRGAIARMIGNAVPPLLAKKIGLTLLDI